MELFKLYALHWGIWVFSVFVLQVLFADRKSLMNTFEFMFITAFMSLASFAIHWGLK